MASQCFVWNNFFFSETKKPFCLLIYTISVLTGFIIGSKTTAIELSWNLQCPSKKTKNNQQQLLIAELWLISDTVLS